MNGGRPLLKPDPTNIVPNTDRPRQIYFFDRRNDERFVYVGFNGSNRLADHRLNGERLLAVMPGGKDFEARIQRHFTALGALADKDFPGSSSTFEGDAIWRYVEWLLREGYAVADESLVAHVPRLPYRVIGPKNVSKHYEDENGQLSFVPTGRRQRLEHAASVAYHRSESDEWYTPPEIIASAKAVMGEIDLDPASCPAANERIGARWFFSQRVDALKQTSWRADEPTAGERYRCRVWMNPPYGNLSPIFAERLIREFSSGNVTEAIALFNANAMSSRWFDVVYKNASRLMVTRGRLRFAPGDPEQSYSSPSTGSVIVYFGPNPDAFEGEFHKHGTIMVVARIGADK